MDDDSQVPEGIALVRDFVNSVELQTAEETLATPDRLAGWLAERGLLVPGAPPGDADVEAAKKVREGLRAVLHLNAGHAADLHAIDELNALLAATAVVMRFDHEGRTGFEMKGTRPLTRAFDAFAKAIVTAQLDGTWERLKACARDSCQWAFYDASRNRSGRWCSMAGCGNYIKMRRVAERRTESGATRRGRAQGDSSRADGMLRE